ncbi:hypothetical protein GOV12_04300 [Candidatus Pacearchaeota archaeon]|nr:hypothetical protein [Candidatus Pacearchaeota archaeon]
MSKVKQIRFGKRENKKGIIGDTFVWVFATFLIVLLLILYMGIVYYMSEKKIIMGRYDVETTGKYYGDFSLTQSFYSFLNTPVDYQDKIYYMKDLLLKSPPDRNDLELYNLINDTMKKYCHEYYIWVPDVGFSEKGTELHIFRGGEIIGVTDGKIRPTTNPIFHWPNEKKEKKFISFSVLRKCLGGKIL